MGPARRLRGDALGDTCTNLVTASKALRGRSPSICCVLPVAYEQILDRRFAEGAISLEDYEQQHQLAERNPRHSEPSGDQPPPTVGATEFRRAPHAAPGRHRHAPQRWPRSRGRTATADLDVTGAECAESASSSRDF